MERISRRRPSPAMVVACAALLVALGGSAVAATPLITGRQIKNGSVTGVDVRNNSLRGADVLESSLGPVPLATNAASATTAANAQSANNASMAANADRLDDMDSSAFAAVGHNHDGRYYTEAEVDALVNAAGNDAWGYVVSSGAGFHASSGNLSVTKPATGEYCVVVPKRGSYKAAQVTLADPGGTKIVSVGTGHGSSCNPLSTPTHDVVPVYIRTTAGAAIDGNFVIYIPVP